MRFELTTPTLARLCSTTELRPLLDVYCEQLYTVQQGGLYDKILSKLQALFLKKYAFFHFHKIISTRITLCAYI